MHWGSPRKYSRELILCYFYVCWKLFPDSCIASYAVFGVGESGFNYWVVILLLHECSWDAPAVLLFLPNYDDLGPLLSPLHQVVYPPV